METKQKKNYVEPSEFFDEVIRCRINGEISNRLGEMFILLATKFSNHQNFVRYAHLKEELISIGAMTCCRAFWDFKPYKKGLGEWDGESLIEYHYTRCYNPHAFFTWCIKNDWLQFLKKEYNLKNVRNGIRLKNGLDPDYGYVDMMKEKERKAKENAPPPKEKPTNGIEW